MEWRRRGAANQPGRRSLHTHAHTHKHAGTIFFKKIKKAGSLSYSCNQSDIFPKRHRLGVSGGGADFGGIGVVISDALVVDCALTGLLPPAPPANPAFPVRPLAQTAGHANLLFPLMFSKKEKKAQRCGSVALLRHRAASNLL